MKSYWLLGWAFCVSSNCTIIPRPRKSSLLAIYLMTPFFVSWRRKFWSALWHLTVLLKRFLHCSPSYLGQLFLADLWHRRSQRTCHLQTFLRSAESQSTFRKKKKKELMSYALKNDHPIHGMQPSLGWPPCPLAKSTAGHGGDGSCLNAQEAEFAGIWPRCWAFIVRVLSSYHPFKLNWHSPEFTCCPMWKSYDPLHFEA